MNVIMIDNYDSFTYNLVQYLGELGCDLEVYRNDRITTDEILDRAPQRLVISPGPGTPQDAGISIEAIRRLAGRVPVLGVCLGHQAIASAYGGLVIRAPELMHGKTSRIHHQGDTILSGIPNPFEATRYHSLVVSPDHLPPCLVVNAWTGSGLIMGLRHREHDIFGVQFHPESVLTDPGKAILENFLCCKS